MANVKVKVTITTEDGEVLSQVKVEGMQGQTVVDVDREVRAAIDASPFLVLDED